MSVAEVVSMWGIREPVSALSHLAGALLAVVALFALRRRAAVNRVNRRTRVGLIVYAASLIFTFAASTLFHLFPGRPEDLVFFKKLDHAAIFVLIAGTCTALLNAGRERGRLLRMTACWAVSMSALIAKMVFWPMALWVSAIVYLSVGWTVAVSVLAALSDAEWDELKLLVYGMILHTAGAVVFAAETPVLWPGMVEGHELFHLIVLAGTALHFLFVWRHCAVPMPLHGRGTAPVPTVSLAVDRQGS